MKERAIDFQIKAISGLRKELDRIEKLQSEAVNEREYRRREEELQNTYLAIMSAAEDLARTAKIYAE